MSVAPLRLDFTTTVTIRSQHVPFCLLVGQQVRQRFAELDVNRDGCVSRSEFAQVCDRCICRLQFVNDCPDHSMRIPISAR